MAFRKSPRATAWKRLLVPVKAGRPSSQPDLLALEEARHQQSHHRRSCQPGILDLTNAKHRESDQGTQRGLTPMEPRYYGRRPQSRTERGMRPNGWTTCRLGMTPRVGMYPQATATSPLWSGGYQAPPNTDDYPAQLSAFIPLLPTTSGQCRVETSRQYGSKTMTSANGSAQ